MTDWQSANRPPVGRDKASGRARFPADIQLEKALCGGVLRSPFAHARILKLDVSRALQIDGVQAIVTSADLPAPSERLAWAEDQGQSVQDLATNLLARTKVLYEGHALAAVAARDQDTVREALAAIEVEFAVLPHIIDVRHAMEPEAPLLHEQLLSRGMSHTVASASNIASRHEIGQGDVESGFADAAVLVSDELVTLPVHHASLVLPACVARWLTHDQVQLWSSASSPDSMQAYCADLLDLPVASIELQPIAAAPWGDHTLAGLEPLAILLARKSGQTVRMQMTRDEVLRVTPAVSGSYITMRVGATKEGRLGAAEAIMCYQAGAFAGSPVRAACQSAFAAYSVPNIRAIGYDVVSNRPKSSDSWAAGAAMAACAVETLFDVLADRLDVDPLVLRSNNLQAAPDLHSGAASLLETARQHPHYLAPLAPNQGRGVAVAPGVDDAGVARGVGAVHICDVEVDPDTGQLMLLRYTAIHPGAADLLSVNDVVRMQGEIARGLGWALNEGYLYDEDGRLLNPGFLDYRLPVASDLPMIDIYGAGIEQGGDVEHIVELALVPVLATVTNAVSRAAGARGCELPLTPPVVLKLIKSAQRRRRR